MRHRSLVGGALEMSVELELELGSTWVKIYPDLITNVEHSVNMQKQQLI